MSKHTQIWPPPLSSAADAMTVVDALSHLPGEVDDEHHHALVELMASEDCAKRVTSLFAVPHRETTATPDGLQRWVKRVELAAEALLGARALRAASEASAEWAMEGALVAVLQRNLRELGEQSDLWLASRSVEGLSATLARLGLNFEARSGPEEWALSDLQIDHALAAWAHGALADRFSTQVRALVLGEGQLSLRWRQRWRSALLGDFGEEGGGVLLRPFLPKAAAVEILDLPTPHLAGEGRLRLTLNPDGRVISSRDDTELCASGRESLVWWEDPALCQPGSVWCTLRVWPRPQSWYGDAQEVAATLDPLDDSNDARQLVELGLELLQPDAGGGIVERSVAEAVVAAHRNEQLGSRLVDLLVVFWQLRVAVEDAAAVHDDVALDDQLLQLDEAWESRGVGWAMTGVPMDGVALPEVFEGSPVWWAEAADLSLDERELQLREVLASDEMRAAVQAGALSEDATATPGPTVATIVQRATDVLIRDVPLLVDAVSPTRMAWHRAAAQAQEQGAATRFLEWRPRDGDGLALGGDVPWPLPAEGELTLMLHGADVVRVALCGVQAVVHEGENSVPTARFDLEALRGGPQALLGLDVLEVWLKESPAESPGPSERWLLV